MAVGQAVDTEATALRRGGVPWLCMGPGEPSRRRRAKQAGTTTGSEAALPSVSGSEGRLLAIGSAEGRASAASARHAALLPWKHPMHPHDWPALVERGRGCR